MNRKNSKINKQASLGRILERKLANYLYFKGYAVIRSAGSGAGKIRPEPDIVVMKNGKFICIEVTTKSELKDIEINLSKIRRIKEFVERAGTKAYLCVKYGEMKFLCIDYDFIFEKAKNKKRGKVRIIKEYILKYGKDVDTIVKEELEK